MTNDNTLTTLDDALYGLRNLAIGDEEETRIGDYDALPADVQALVDAGDYDAAYRLAIKPFFAGMTRDDVAAAVAAWAFDWCMSEGGDDDDDMDSHVTLAADMMNVYDSL